MQWVRTPHCLAKHPAKGHCEIVCVRTWRCQRAQLANARRHPVPITYAFNSRPERHLRNASTVREDMPHGNFRLAVATELWPIACDGCIVLEQAAFRLDVNRGRYYRLGDGEYIEQGLAINALTIVGISQTCPRINHEFPI